MNKSNFRQSMEYFKANANRFNERELIEASEMSTGYFKWVICGGFLGAGAAFGANRYFLSKAESKGMSMASKVLVFLLPVALAHSYFINKRAMPFFIGISEKYKAEDAFEQDTKLEEKPSN